jgi:Na+/H+ antiporter NhaC
MDKENAKLNFYGGEWMSFLPFALFLLMIVLTTFVWGSISDGALWLPAFLALVITFFVAKDKVHYSEVLINGMASREAIIPIVCWLFAGVFSRILRESGLAGAIAGVAAGVGIGGTFFTIITFVAACVFATASGTGFGTIAAGMGVLYPAGVALGCHPALLAGAVVSGAIFGDNLAPVSDTTICSATSQGVDVPGVVRSRLKYALVSAGITIIIFIILGTVLGGGQRGPAAGAITYNPLALLMLAAVALTIIVAIKTGDIIIATIIGSVSGSVIGVLLGLFDFLQIDPVEGAKNALIRVYGEGLDRTVGGTLYTGLSSMLQVCILALLLFGSISIMRRGHGDQKLLNSLGTLSKSAAGAEFVISIMVIILSTLMGLNAPAILAVGASFAKPLSEKHGISPYRTANLLDAQSNTFVYSAPWTPAVIYTISFAAGTEAPLRATEITPMVIYCYVLLAVMTVSIFLGIGRKDGMEGKTAAAS